MSEQKALPCPPKVNSNLRRQRPDVAHYTEMPEESEEIAHRVAM
jgi:hypothetical protein